MCQQRKGRTALIGSAMKWTAVKKLSVQTSISISNLWKPVKLFLEISRKASLSNKIAQMLLISPWIPRKINFNWLPRSQKEFFLQGHVANIHRNFKNLLQLTYCSQRPAAFRRSSLSSGSLKTNLLRCMGRKFVSAEAKLRPANKMKESSRSCVVESASREVVSFECYTVGE